jgi:hypothetical protein
MKIFNGFLAALLLGIFTTITGCESEPSDSVDQDKIHVRYVLEYNANTDITQARVQFRFGNALGTILQLADGASIKFNGADLTWNSVLAYYVKEYTGLVSTGNFVYTDVNGTTFNNTASVPPAIAFPTITSVDINSAWELTWVGSAVAANENVWVSIEGTNTTGTGQIETTYNVGATSVIFALNKLQNLGTGHSIIFMDRNHELSTGQFTGAGGAIVGRYKALNISNVQFTN